MAEGLGFASIWEGDEVVLHRDYCLSKHEAQYRCPHLKDGKVARVIVTTNECGYNSVGICADCLIDALARREADPQADTSDLGRYVKV